MVETWEYLKSSVGGYLLVGEVDDIFVAHSANRGSQAPINLTVEDGDITVLQLIFSMPPFSAAPITCYRPTHIL